MFYSYMKVKYMYNNVYIYLETLFKKYFNEKPKWNIELSIFARVG